MTTSAPIQLLRGLLIHKLVEVEAGLKLMFCHGLNNCEDIYIYSLQKKTSMCSGFTNSVYVKFHTIMSLTDLCKAVDILQTDIVIDTNYHMHGKDLR